MASDAGLLFREPASVWCNQGVARMRIPGKIYRRQIHSYDGDYGDVDYSPTPPYPDINITGDIDTTICVAISEWQTYKELTEDEKVIIRWRNRINALSDPWWLL